jgi:hypothetical protein
MAKLTAVPSLKSSKSTLRLKQNIILSALIAGFLMGPLGFIISANRSVEVPQVNTGAEVLGVQNQISGLVSFARTVAEDYLSGRATLLPTAKDVPQDFGRGAESGPMAHGALDLISVLTTSATTETAGGVSYAVTFRFQSDGASMWQLEIIVHPGGGQPVLGALPSLTPFTVQGNFGSNGTQDQMGLGGELIEVTPAVVTNAVDAWAKAYVGGDPEALKQHVNLNGDASFSYTPLGGGFSLTSSRVLGVTASLKVEKGYAARVRLQLQKGSFTTSTEYDVLVTDDAVGHVVAWGAPGTAPSLEPRGNRNR